MQNIPTNIRIVIYLLGVFLNAFTASLVASGVHLAVWIIATLAGYNALMALMAKANVTPEK